MSARYLTLAERKELLQKAEDPAKCPRAALWYFPTPFTCDPAEPDEEPVNEVDDDDEAPIADVPTAADEALLIQPVPVGVRWYCAIERTRGTLRTSFRALLQEQCPDTSYQQAATAAATAAASQSNASSAKQLTMSAKTSERPLSTVAPSNAVLHAGLLVGGSAGVDKSKLEIGTGLSTAGVGLKESVFLVSAKRTRSTSTRITHIWDGASNGKNSLAQIVTSQSGDKSKAALHFLRLVGVTNAARSLVRISTEGTDRLVKLTAVIPEPTADGSSGDAADEAIVDALKEAERTGQAPPGFLFLRSRPAQWSAWQSCYTLSFLRGEERVLEPSRKNISVVLVPANGGEEALRSAPTVLQMGKMGDGLFSLDYSWPFSPLQATAFGLTVHDH